VPGSKRPWTEDEGGCDEGGRVSGAATVAPSALAGAGDSTGSAGGGVATGNAGADGSAAPHSGQKRPGAVISRLQDGQVGIGEGEYFAAREEGTD